MQDYKRPRELVRERPTPMFGYNSAEGYWDIPFPDFTFYGHEHSWLVGKDLCLPRALYMADLSTRGFLDPLEPDRQFGGLRG